MSPEAFPWKWCQLMSVLNDEIDSGMQGTPPSVEGTLAGQLARRLDPVLLLFLLGLITEIVLAVNVSEHAIQAGGLVTLVTLSFMAWFWLTLSGGLFFVARFSATGRFKPFTCLVMVGIVWSLLFTYVASWAVYFQTGRFANLETIRFTVSNFSMLHDYLAAADPRQFILAGLLGLSIFLAVFLLVRQYQKPGSQHQPNRFLGIAWLIVTLALVVTMNPVVVDASAQRRASNLNRLSGYLNPAASMVVSSWEFLSQPRIECCLNESELVPLADSPVVQPIRRMNVIMVAVESLRADTIGLQHQGQPVLPNLNRLAEQSLVWNKAYAQSTHSDYADVCLVSSLYPLRRQHHHFYHQDDPWPKTLIYDVLKPAGYATAIISSQNEAWGAMDQFLQTDGLDLFYHPETSSAPTYFSEKDTGFSREKELGTLVAGKFPDRHTTDVAIDWIQRQSRQGTPFYLSMNLQSSHFPYLLPPDVQRPFQPSALPDSVKFACYPKERVPVVRNAYFNGIHECDHQIGRLIEQLKQMGIWEDTILVVTGENGEAFHENGCIGHAGNPKEPVIHVANLFSAPGLLSPGTDDYPMEHVDLVPTIMGLLGVEPHPNFQGIDVLAEDRTPLNERLIFSHVSSPIAQADSIQYAGRWKFLTTQQFPEGQLFDLHEDPGESQDVGDQYPELRRFLAAGLKQWRARQLSYYYHSKYYRNFYPPRPPSVQEICDAAHFEFSGIGQPLAETEPASR
jgi:arylsulfatase A-like enzyme